MNRPAISLSEVLQSQDFARSISEGSQLAYNEKRESGFLVYTDETLSPIIVNKPALFGRHEADERDSTSTPGFGFRGDLYCPSLIHVHFHSPGSKAMPSYSDLHALREVRDQNRNLGESCDADYLVNPLAIVGYPADLSKSELFLFQVKIGCKNSEYDLIKKLAKTYSEVRGVHLEPLAMDIMGNFGWLFRSPKTMARFLEKTGLYIAEIVHFENGKIRNDGLRRLYEFDCSLFEEVPKEEDECL